jgi:lipoprotein Spr
LNSGSNQVIATTVAEPAATSNEPATLKFLDDISVTAGPTAYKTELKAGGNIGSGKSAQKTNSSASRPAEPLEKVSPLHIKYALLLNTEAEHLQDCALLPYIDEWYGTRYRMGGTTKKGIDCSAFVQTIYMSAFAVALPRTAREQYKTSRIISATQLKEGDLVFFNTTGGVSHVGIYLQNNKFVHASSSNGVVISDLFDPYYLKRYLGAGRIEKPEANIR